MVAPAAQHADGQDRPRRIDVLMTAYNAAATIDDALSSMQAQTFRDIRIVIVDDGSTDDTCSIVARRAATDPRVVLLKKEHGGIVPALRYGLAHCDAPLIARFDADDVSFPDRLERQLAQLDADPDRIATASAARHVDLAGRWLGTVTAFGPPDQADARWIPAREPYMLQPFLLVRRSALDAAGGYRLCEVGEDSDLYWRLHAIGKLTNTSDVLGDYRWHANSISSGSIVRGRRIAFWSQLIAASALRRQQGLVDLDFDDDRLEAVANATTLEQHCRAGTRGLTAAELTRLRAGVAMKLLEVATYRPFELDRSDCRFARRALAAASSLISSDNRREANEAVFNAVMRFAFAGAWMKAFLLDPRSFPVVVGRWTYRTTLPEALRDRIKRLRRRR